MASTSMTFIALFTNSHFFGDPANLNIFVKIVVINYVKSYKMLNGDDADDDEEWRAYR